MTYTLTKSPRVIPPLPVQPQQSATLTFAETARIESQRARHMWGYQHGHHSSPTAERKLQIQGWWDQFPNEPFTAAFMAKEWGCTQGAASYRMNMARKDGLIIMAKARKGNEPSLWEKTK